MYSTIGRFRRLAAADAGTEVRQSARKALRFTVNGLPMHGLAVLAIQYRAHRYVSCAPERVCTKLEQVVTWKLTLEYDGTKYSGWQEQKNARTVQGDLNKAAAAFFGCEVETQGAGRTDAGVHALAQIAHLRAEVKGMPDPSDLRSGLNTRLAADICVLDVERVPNRFHARHDALTRTYLYQISTRKTAFAKKFVWWIKEPLDVEIMSRAALKLAGRHDFRSFRAPDPARPSESTIVVVDSASVEEHEHLILFHIEASHFLWRMVRRLVGVLVKLGRHELDEDGFMSLLNAEPDPQLDVAAWTAPASGLFLERVRYR